MMRDRRIRSDAAAFVYIRSCLMGRAHRFRKKQSTRVQREPATLNEPVGQDEDGVDKLSLVAASDPKYNPNRVTERITLQSAMRCLTPNERQIIEALYFQDRKVVKLCKELQVSKNTVLKTKRRALGKLRAYLKKSTPKDQEE